MAVAVPARAAAFADGHPAFGPFERWLAGGLVPAAPEILNRWAAESALALADGRPLRFVAAPARRIAALAYEGRILAHGEIATRAGSLHDFCNALAWLAFPRTKAALARCHLDAADRGTPSGGRGPARDAATLLDEHGAIVLARNRELVALWRARAWREVFDHRAAEVERDMVIAVLGHGLLAKLAAPYPRLTAHVLVIATSSVLPDGDPSALLRRLDEMAADWLKIRGARSCPADWLPLPIAAWPSWRRREAPSFFDPRVFRPATSQASRRPPS